MRLRVIIATVLIISSGIATAGHPSTARQTSPITREDEQKLTQEEEREARALITRFSERLRAANDIGPLVDELFVADFSYRLSRAPEGGLPVGFLDRTLMAAARGDALRRYYIASINFYNLYFRLYEVMADIREQAGESRKDPEPKEVLSPEIINTLLSDPRLAEIAEEFKKEDDNESAKETHSDPSSTNRDTSEAPSVAAEDENNGPGKDTGVSFIKSENDLKSVSATMEQVVDLMRNRLASLVKSFRVNEDEPSQDDSVGAFDIISLEEGEYGYPAGTQAIHVNVLPFCLTLIRVYGELKILSVALYVD